MAKSKKKKKEKAFTKKPKSDKVDLKENEADDNFDFGGLPNRDLKKNLGCG